MPASSVLLMSPFNRVDLKASLKVNFPHLTFRTLGCRWQGSNASAAEPLQPLLVTESSSKDGLLLLGVILFSLFCESVARLRQIAARSESQFDSTQLKTEREAERNTCLCFPPRNIFQYSVGCHVGNTSVFISAEHVSVSSSYPRRRGTRWWGNSSKLLFTDLRFLMPCLC